MTQRVHQFSNGACSFDVMDEGPLDGEVIVLLHGFPQTAKSWDAVCALLNERGYRTLRFDQRGYAPRARPRGRYAYRIEALTSDVAALLAAAGGGPVHLVGHDWGAAVGWAFAGRYPERLKSLTAVSVPHPRAFLGAMLSSDQAARSYYMGLFQLPWLAEWAMRQRTVHARKFMRMFGMTDDQIDRVQDEVAAGGLVGGVNWYRAIIFASPLNLRSTTVPTTYVWSKGDIALSRRGAELCGRYVNAPYELEVLEGTHWIPEQDPERLTEIIAKRVRGRENRRLSS